MQHGLKCSDSRMVNLKTLTSAATKLSSVMGSEGQVCNNISWGFLMVVCGKSG